MGVTWRDLLTNQSARASEFDPDLVGEVLAVVFIISRETKKGTLALTPQKRLNV
jgi:ABC-type histidine transport system ATPase subunit